MAYGSEHNRRTRGRGRPRGSRNRRSVARRQAYMKRSLTYQPTYSKVKSKRSVNAPNQIKFKGKNMTLRHRNDLSKAGFKIFKQLTKGGVLEKRLIQHNRFNYEPADNIAGSNNYLQTMSGISLNYGQTAPDPASVGTSSGIPKQIYLSGFQIGAGVSPDKYVFLKNFQSEITITTMASNFQGIPDPAQAAELSYVNTLNFRVLLLQKKPGFKTTAGLGPQTIEPNFANSLFLNYNNDPIGLSQDYGGSTFSNSVSPIDVLMGKMNMGMWNVLQDKRFLLSVPVANVAGAESKYPNMKKLVFKHPINQKVQVSTGSTGTKPLDWDDSYHVLIFAGLPNSSAAFDSINQPITVVPRTNKLWRVSTRGFTSYIDA